MDNSDVIGYTGAMVSVATDTFEPNILESLCAFSKLHSRAREAETACRAGVSITKSLERIEIPLCIYDSCDGLGLLSKDPIGFAAGDTNLYRMTGNHPNMATDPSGLITEDEWNNSALFNSVRDSGRGHLQKLRGMYFTEQALGNNENADSILDAARVHASLHSGGLHSDHDKFLKHDASVRGMQHGRFGQSVIATSNGLDYVGQQMHEGFEFAVDVKMILNSNAMVEGDQFMEVAPGIYERNRYISPREMPYDKRQFERMTLQAEIDVTLAMLTMGGSTSRKGYQVLDDAWGYQRLPTRLVDIDISKVRISQTLESNAEMRNLRKVKKLLGANAENFTTDLPFDDQIHVFRHEGVDYLVNGHNRKVALEHAGKVDVKAIYITKEELFQYGGTTPEELVRISAEANRIGNRIREY